jgi:hypothetical protein
MSRSTAREPGTYSRAHDLSRPVHDLPHPLIDPAGEPVDVHRSDLTDRLEPLKFGLERLLSAHVGSEAHPQFLLGQGAVCEGVDQPVELLLNLNALPLRLGTPLDLGTLALRQIREVTAFSTARVGTAGSSASTMASGPPQLVQRANPVSRYADSS